MRQYRRRRVHCFFLVHKLLSSAKGWEQGGRGGREGSSYSSERREIFCCCSARAVCSESQDPSRGVRRLVETTARERGRLGGQVGCGGQQRGRWGWTGDKSTGGRLFVGGKPHDHKSRLWRKGRGKGSGVHQRTWENGVQGIGGEGVEGESARCVEIHVHASAQGN
jgi:hypothetical protein